MTQPAAQSYPLVLSELQTFDNVSISCSASTTATNSGFPENLRSESFSEAVSIWRSNPLLHPLPDVMCDWLSGSHAFRYPREPRNSGQIMKLSPDGEVEWLSQSWESLKCASSDTSLRVKCDGSRLWFSGNVGRFQERDNLLGLTVPQCVAKWKRVLARLGLGDLEFGTAFTVEPMPGIPVTDTWSADCARRGTVLSRVDLAANFRVSCFSDFCQVLAGRVIGRHVPIMGRYGPTWGYGKRANWWKGKVYDKSAEQEGKRRSSGGETVARFEVQLGAEFLKRRGLDRCAQWKTWKTWKTSDIDGLGAKATGEDMGQVVWAEFGGQVFREMVPDRVWGDEMPAKLREKAYMWRAGEDLRVVLGKSQFYVWRKKLLSYGIDIAVPCNAEALKPTIQAVRVEFLPALRQA